MRPVLIVIAIVIFGVSIGQESSALTEQLEAERQQYQRLLQEREQDIARAQEALRSTSAELQNRVAERDQVASQLEALTQERQVLVGEIEALNVLIAETRAEITELSTRLDALRVRVEGLMLNLFRQRSGRFANALGQAESFHDLQVNNYYLSLLSEQDVSLINELNETVAQLASVQAQQQQQLGELTSKETELRANEQALAERRERLTAVVRELESTREGQLAEQQRLSQARANLEASIVQVTRDLEAEVARLERAAEERRRRAQAAQAVEERRRLEREAESLETTATTLSRATLPPLASGYVYPLEEPRLVGRFGEGISGIRLQALRVGAAVRAVQPGVVVTTDYVSANQGYNVVIQHSGGLTTAYVNLQSNLVVRVGETVSQGQTIGYLGGGALIPGDVLEFYTIDGSGNFRDPAMLLGF
jgi:septal ring factor EnvC (AmiA/AmiB activator)